MAHIPRNPVVKTRTERESEHGKAYVIVAGAPAHYIGGYGVVGPGAIITLPEGTEPGKWLEEINSSDVDKVAADPDKAADLAEAAGVRKKESDAEAQKREAEEAADLEKKQADVAAAALVAAGGKPK